jgi:hypothetical protein
MQIMFPKCIDTNKNIIYSNTYEYIVKYRLILRWLTFNVACATTTRFFKAGELNSIDSEFRSHVLGPIVHLYRWVTSMPAAFNVQLDNQGTTFPEPLLM